MTRKKITGYSKDEELMAKFAKALAHPARISILKLLSKQDTCYCGDIVEELPIAQATVSQHLKELKEAGLIQGTIEGPKVCYCLNPKNWDFFKKIFADFLK